MPQIYDMGPTVLLALRRVVDFFYIYKNIRSKLYSHLYKILGRAILILRKRTIS